MSNPEEQKEMKADQEKTQSQSTTFSPSLQLQEPIKINVGSLNAFSLPQPPAINIQVPLTLGGESVNAETTPAPTKPKTRKLTNSQRESISSTPTFLDSTYSFGRNTNLNNSRSGPSGIDPFQPTVSQQSSDPSPSFRPELCLKPSLQNLPVPPAIQVPSMTPSTAFPSLASSFGLPQPSLGIQVNVPSLQSVGSLNHLQSVAPPTISIGQISLAGAPSMAAQTVVPSQASTVGFGSSLGGGTALSVKIDMGLATHSTEGTLNSNAHVEKASELNLKDLESSDDEDLSAGPSGGCTGEPQQFKKPTEYRPGEGRRFLGTGSGIEIISRKDSQQSGMTSTSETSDQVHPMMKLKRNQTMMPKFEQGTFNEDLNGEFQSLFQINSFRQAQKKIEDLYEELNRVALVAKGYRSDFLTLQDFIKNHFKSADLLFKNSALLADNDFKTKEVLKSCFQETPCITMAFASPLCLRVIDPSTQQERVSEMPQLDFAKEFKSAVQTIEETGNSINVQIVPATLEKFTNSLMQKPMGLHFTGHGVENNAATLGQDTFLMYNQGNCLVFEKEDASAHFVSQQKLKDLFEMHVASLKFVFIATCHSEFAGEIFHEAGVDHVICVKQGYTIADPAAIFFARKFYQTLFMEKYTICESFKMAKDCLKMHPEYALQLEADKLIMILNTDEVKPRGDQSTQSRKNLPGRNNFSLESSLPVSSKEKKDKSKQKVKKEHQCCVLGPFMKRDHELIEQKPTYPFEVAKICEFVGRQREMQEIIAAVLQNRFTTVLGVPGIGKTTISKSIGFHLAERKTFHDGIMFFTMRGKDQTTAFIQMLFLFLKKHDPTEGVGNAKNGKGQLVGAVQPQSMVEKNRLLKQQSAMNAVQSTAAAGGAEAAGGQAAAKLPIFGQDQPVADYKADYLEMEQKIHAYLEAKQTLIIIDNLEDVLREDEESLRRFLTELLEKLPGVSILTTSRQKVQNLGEITERLYELRQLTNDFSIQLLEKKCLRPITEEEVKELFEVPAPMQKAFNTPFQSSQNQKKTHVTSANQRLRIEDHHLCTLLGGHPHAISLVAPFLQNNRRLADLYKMLLNMIASEDFMKDMNNLDPTQSLKVSMDTSTMHMRSTQPEALNLFCLLGMLPGGVSEIDLPILWQSDQWLVLTESLRRASLIVESVQESFQPGGGVKSLRTFRLLPFMNKYAESLLSPFDRNRFHNQSCTWLLTKLMEMFYRFKTEQHRGDNSVFSQMLMQVETNIWTCIYRICDFNRDRKAMKKLQDQESSQIHQQALTGYSSAADEFEAVLLRNNMSVMQENSDVSVDEKNLNQSDQSKAVSAKGQQQTQSSSEVVNPAQAVFNFRIGNRLQAKLGAGNTSQPVGIRKLSSEEQDLMQQNQIASDSSMRDNMSSHTLSQLGLSNQTLSQANFLNFDPLQEQATEEIPERPYLEDASFNSSADAEVFQSQQQAFEELAKEKRKVSFALNSSHQENTKKSNLRAKQLNTGSGEISIDSYRLKNSTSPFNATLSQIDAKNSESNETSTLTPQNLGMKSIKVSRLSFAETHGDGQDFDQMTVMGSIDQSVKSARNNDDEQSFKSDGEDSAQQQPKKKLVKSNTQKYLDLNMVDKFQDSSDEIKRQSSTTDNLMMKKNDILAEHDLSFMSEKLVAKGPSAITTPKQIMMENVDDEVQNNNSSFQTGNAFDISFNVQNLDVTAKGKTVKTLSGSNDNSKTLSSDQIKGLQITQERSESPGKTKDEVHENGIQQTTTQAQKLKHFGWPKNTTLKQQLSAWASSQRPFGNILKSSQSKQIIGSMALKSKLEIIQENYELSNDSLLIVVYISLLVLNQKYGDAIRAIEIVNSSEPTDPLLIANLKKLNAYSLMKSETGKFQLQVSINQAYRQYKEAKALFDKVGRKRNTENEANLGIAMCKYGMAMIMLKNPFNFVREDMDEGKCLEHVLTLLTDASVIYKKRQHYGGAVQCLQNMAITQKKLSKPYIYLKDETMKMRRQMNSKQGQQIKERHGCIQVPRECVVRHDGWEVSLLTEIIDSLQLSAPVQQPSSSRLKPVERRMPTSGSSKATEQKLSLPSSRTQTKTKGSTAAPAPGRKTAGFSPQASKKAEKEAQGGGAERSNFGRKNQKQFTSQTRKGNEYKFHPQQQLPVPGKTMHMISQNSLGSTDDSLQSNQQKQLGGLKQVKHNNFLSDTTQSENEIIIKPVSNHSLAGPTQKSKKKKGIQNIVQQAFEDPPLEDIEEKPFKTQQIAERQERAKQGIAKSKQLGERNRRRHEHEEAPIMNPSPRPSFKGQKRPMPTTTSRPSDGHEEEKKHHERVSAGHTALAHNKKTLKAAGTIQLPGASSLTPLKEIKDKSKIEDKRRTQLVGASPQEIFQMAQKLDLDDEVYVPEFLQIEKAQASQAGDMETASQSVVSDFLETSFTTNDDQHQLRRQTLQQKSSANQTVGAAAQILQRRPMNKKYAHVKSKIATYITQDKQESQSTTTSRQGTPVRSRMSHDPSKQKLQANVDVNPFGVAEDAVPSDVLSNTSYATNMTNQTPKIGASGQILSSAKKATPARQ